MDEEVWLFLVPPVELTDADHACPIADTDSVLWTLDDHPILCSLWNTTTASPWQFRLYKDCCTHTHIYL